MDLAEAQRQYQIALEFRRTARENFDFLITRSDEIEDADAALADATFQLATSYWNA